MDERTTRDEEPGAPSATETFDLEAEDEEAVADEPRRLDADYLLDKVIPEGIDWRDLVRRHPFLSVGAVAAVGFLLGRSKGAAIVAGVSAGLTTAVMRQLSDVFEGEVFEF
jgi:hypothetical protein